MNEKIQNAYKSSKNVYDDVLTHKGFLSRLYNKIFWSDVDDNEIAEIILKYIPDTFKGKLLDVPVGTAIFTSDKYHILKGAKIICLDYSEDMLNQAKERLSDLNNINFVRGDVACMPFNDSEFDIVLSMNGLHVFPNKTKAYKEISRVLKRDGLFIACFYIKEKSKISDWLVNNILAKKGWFNPPFENYEDVLNSLKDDYVDININVKGSIVYFIAKKRNS